MGQACLEISTFIFFGWVIQSFLSRKIYLVYIGLIFTFFCLHILDFVLNRLMDITVWETISLILDESFANFIELLHAANISLTIWFLLFGSVLLLPFLGILLYLGTEKLIRAKELKIPRDHFIAGFFFIPVSLFIWDYSASHMIHADAYHAYLSSLPWKMTFLEPKRRMLTYLHTPSRPRKEEILREKIANKRVEAETKPNIYLFIVESFREDFVTEKIMPNLTRFREENVSFPVMLSNANFTQGGWYSIFYSNFIHYWADYQNAKLGSPALQLLKKAGYEIHVNSSAGLKYYNMERFLFGKNSTFSLHITPSSIAPLSRLTKQTAKRLRR